MPSSVGLSGTMRVGVESVFMAPMIARGPAGTHPTKSWGPPHTAGPQRSARTGQVGICRAMQPLAVSISGLALIIEIVVPP